MIRVVRTTGGHDRDVVADLLNRLAIAKTTGRAAILRTAALDTAPGPDTPMSTSVPTSKSSAIPHSSVGFARAAIDHRTFSTAIWAVTLRSARVSAGDPPPHAASPTRDRLPTGHRPSQMPCAHGFRTNGGYTDTTPDRLSSRRKAA